MKIQGIFLGSGAIKEVGDNGYKVRTMWIDTTTNPEYPNTPEFNLGGDKCVYLTEDFKAGELVEVLFDIDGKKYTGKDGKSAVFTKLRAYGINKVATTDAPAAKPAATTTAKPATKPPVADDDLPF